MKRHSDTSGSMHLPWLLVIAALLSITLLTSSASAANFSAATSVNLTGLADPNQVASGDFDKDGNQDLVSVSLEDNKVRFAKGDGSGGFTRPWQALNLATGGGEGPFAVAVGDFDKDTNPDIAVANIYSNNVSVFLGKGDGTFYAATVYETGNYPTSITAADFDGDTSADLAVTNYGDDTVSVFLNAGTGLFDAAVTYSTGAGPYAVKTGIFTASGNLDLIVANYNDDSISLLTGNGDGTFDAKSDTTAGSGPVSVVTGDFEGDTNLDVATANFADNTVSILIGNGAGGFAATVSYNVGFEPLSIASGNFNGTTTGGGDGYLDLVVANRGDDNVTLLRGVGDGTFEFAQNYAVGTGPSSIIAADLDSDSLDDIVTANRFSNDASVLLAIDETDAPTGSISITDLDADGYVTSATVSLTLTAAEETGNALDSSIEMCISDDINYDCTGHWVAFDASPPDFTFADTSDGLKAIFVWFRDARGNVSSYFYDTIILKTTPPGSPIVINNNAVFTSSAAVTLSLAGAGATGMRICNNAACTLNDSGWIAYASSKNWTLAGGGDGTKTVYVYFRDTLHTSAQFSDSIILDTTAPTGSIVISNGQSTTLSTSVDLALTASEESGGAVQMCISNTDVCSAWEAFAASKAWTLTAGEGAKTVTVRFQDERGNVSSPYSDTIQFNTSLPTGSILINNGAVSTDTLTVTLTLTKSASALDMCVSNSTTCDLWVPAKTSLDWTLDSAGGDGVKTVYAWFRTEDGIVSARYSDTIKYDTTAPETASIVIDAGAEITSSPTVTLTLSATDSLTAVSEMCISNTNSCTDWIVYATTKSWTLSAGEGTKTVYAWFKDAQGNATAAPVSDTIILDSLTPTGTISINGGDPTTGTSSVTLTLSATDATSSVTEMCISNTNSCTDWIVYATTKSWTLSAGEGTKTVYAWFKDAQGNATAAPVSDTIILDSLAPTGTVSIDGGAATTGTTSVTLTLSATDASSSVTHMCISGTTTCSEGSDWIAYATSHPWTVSDSDGTKTVYIWFKDTQGNATTADSPISDTIILDRVAPTGTFSINGGAGTTNSTTVILTMTATDASSVVGEMCISNDTVCSNGSGWIAYAATKSWTMTPGQGGKTVYAWFKDIQGNATAADSPISDSIILDSVAPTGTVVLNGDTAATNSTAVTLTLAATDDSTITQMCISNTSTCAGGTGYVAYATPYAHTLAAGDGLKTVNVWFKDEWGNATAADSPHTDTILLDTTPPLSRTVSIDAGATATASTTVELTLTGTDATSIEEMCISNTTTCSSWEPFTSPKSWTLESGDGTKTVRVWLKDAVGNANPIAVLDTITLDTTAPTGSVVINSGSTSTISANVALTLAAAGASHMCISNTSDIVDKDTCPGSGWIAFATSKAWTLAGGGDGSKTVYVWFKDALGNTTTSPYSDSIILDSTAPTGTISINAGGDYTSSTAVTLTLSADSATQMCVSNTVSCSTWVAFATTKSWTLSTGAGLKTVYVLFRDDLGNTSPQVSDTITLDSTAPTNGTVTAANGIEEVVLAWSAFADGGSGIASYKVVSSTTAAPSNCTGTAIYAGALLTYTHAGLVNGTTYYYRVCAIDKAGNMSSGATASAMAVAEKDAPVGTVSIAADAAATKTTSVTLTISATDDNGPIEMCVSNTNTCSAWAAYATSKTWTLTTGNGTKTVKVWFRDKFKNTTAEPASDTIVYDTVAPVNGTLTATAGNGEVELEWTGFSDAGSGIESYKLVYSTSSSPTSCSTGTQIGGALGSGVSSYTHAELTNGMTYYYRLCAIDGLAYTSSGATARAIPTPETTSPTGTITINGGALYTNKTGATLSLTVSDAPDNSSPYQVCISNTANCTSYATFASTKTWTLTSGNGEKTVNVWFRDKYSNTSAKYSATITLDATVPANGTLSAAAIDSQNDLTWSGFSDVGSSIASYKLVVSSAALPTSCSTGTVLYAGTATTYSHISLTNGTTYYYRVCAIDQAGNTSTGATASARWIPETTPPSGTVSINNGAAYTGTASVTLTLSATDADSTVTQMCISNTTSCTSWAAYVTSKTWTLATSTSTTKTVNVWFRDEWGNTSAMTSDSIVLDTVKPVNGTVTPTAANAQVTLDWAGFADAASGIASYKIVSSTSSAPASCSGTGIYTGPDSVTTFTHLGLTNGTTYYYRVCAVDAVGNMSTGTTATATPSAQ